MFNRDNIDRLVKNRMLPGARRLTQAVTRPWQDDQPLQRAKPSALLIADDDDDDDSVVFDNASMVEIDAKEDALEEVISPHYFLFLIKTSSTSYFLPYQCCNSERKSRSSACADLQWQALASHLHQDSQNELLSARPS